MNKGYIMSNTEQQIVKFLELFNSEIGSLTQQLRDHLRKETKPTIELVFHSYLSLNIGYGFTEKAWDCFCAIIVYSKHINISFPSGAFLSDPQGLLQGTGKKIRHIKIKGLNDIKTPAVKNILLEARTKALALVEEKHNKKYSIKTVVKPISGITKKFK